MSVETPGLRVTMLPHRFCSHAVGFGDTCGELAEMKIEGQLGMTAFMCQSHGDLYAKGEKRFRAIPCGKCKKATPSHKAVWEDSRGAFFCSVEHAESSRLMPF